MNQRQANNIVKLIKALKQVPEEQFDFSHICKIDKNKVSPFNCGTVACAYGHFPQIFPNKYKWGATTYEDKFDVVLKNSKVDDYYKRDEAITQACEDLGMTDYEFRQIFLARGFFMFYGVSTISQVTKKMVISKLTQFMKDKGWSIA